MYVCKLRACFYQPDQNRHSAQAGYSRTTHLTQGRNYRLYRYQRGRRTLGRTVIGWVYLFTSTHRSRL